VGERLATMAELDPAEFGFGEARRPLGGPAPYEDLESYTAAEFLRILDRVSARIAEREQTLDALESILHTLQLQDQTRPAGRPIVKGWISSFYGYRTDPMSGKKSFHGGVDFAGPRGSDVVAVASGVVTWSGRRQGYGHLVEVAHGNGLVTRYAHNQRNLVEVGETVKKGHVIALMGSSGRATGPHVHFEVLRDGRSVNPIQYVRADD
jgi:murein DD-endopeptidase MepM/ murein hydrolase activator NlpD